MKKNFIRVVAVALLAIMAVSTVSCANTDMNNPESTPAVKNPSDSSTPDESTAVNAENILGPRDFAGETLTFYSCKYNGAWSSDLLAEDIDGTILNDAIYKRNSKLSAIYSVDFEQIESGTRDCLSDVEKKLAAGDIPFQALYLSLSNAAVASQRGLLQDITELDNINLQGPWWTQTCNATWSIGGSQYFATGAITTTDDMAIRTMFFNKDIIAEHQLKTIYDLVYDNEWVFEKFFEYAEIAKKDDGDGFMTENDIFGVSDQGALGFTMTIGAGEIIIGKDADDYPRFAVSDNSTRFLDVTSYLTDKIAGNDSIYFGSGNSIIEMFGNGRSLFFPEVLLHAQTMRVSYDLKFGLVPMPKYNAEQENYHQFSTGRNTTVVCFPRLTVDDELDMATFIVEAMAIESVETVTPALYDLCLKGRYFDDPESAEMLDILTTSVATDLVEIFGWSDFTTNIQNAISSGSPISSLLKKNISAAEKVMKKAIEDFKDLE